MTSQLTADRSTTELLRNNKPKEAYSCSLEPAYDRTNGFVNLFFSHTPGEKVTIASPSPVEEPPRQGGCNQPSPLEIHFDQSILKCCQFTK